MYVGTQYIGTSRIEMEFLARHGVAHCDAIADSMDAATLLRHREDAARCGVDIEMVHVQPMMNITSAIDPERDREIERFCTCIENAAVAGLRGLNYNFCVLDARDSGGLVQRTARTPGRGGSTYSTFRMAETGYSLRATYHNM